MLPRGGGGGGPGWELACFNPSCLGGVLMGRAERAVKGLLSLLLQGQGWEA